MTMSSPAEEAALIPITTGLLSEADKKHVDLVKQEAASLMRKVRDAGYTYLGVGTRGALLPAVVSPNRVVQFTDPDAFNAFMHRHLEHLPPRCANDTVARVRYRLMGAPIMASDIRPVAWRSELPHTYCWARLDSDYREVTACPTTFQEFLDRIETDEERRSFCIWLGALLDPRPDRSQMLYLHGPGGDGKSFLLGALASLFGNAKLVTDPDHIKSRFGVSSLEDKALVIVQEQDDDKFVDSAICKRITGDNVVGGENKNEKYREMKLQCQLIVTSNYPPRTSGLKAAKRRLVYVRVRSFEGKRTNWIDELQAQATDILCYCTTLYRAWRTEVGPYDPLPVGKDALDVVDANSQIADFEAAFEVAFDRGAEFECSTAAIRAWQKEQRMTPMETQRFNTWLTSQFGPSKPANRSGKMLRVYGGFKRAVTESGLAVSL